LPTRLPTRFGNLFGEVLVGGDRYWVQESMALAMVSASRVLSALSNAT
jgi:hypothetical protein